MGWKAVKSTKCCATCANWGGPRQATFGAADVEKPGTYGKCYEGVFSGVTSGHCACQGTSCPKYRLWSALK